MSSQLHVLRKYTAPDYESFLSKWASRSYPPHPDILSALRSFFLDTSIPISQIVKRAVDHMIKQQTEEPSQCGPSCGPLFMVLRDVVKAYPAHNDRFIEFVVELQDISFPGGSLKDQMYKMGQDLTEFEFGQIEPSPFDSNIIPERQGYINLCAFIAKLHNRGIRTADKISDLSRGAQVLTEALEEAPWEKHHHEDIEAYLPQESEIEDDEDEDFYEEKRDELLAKKDIRILDRRVPGAAQWVFICGREIYGKLGVEDFGEEGRGPIWTGEKGWSRGRWGFWRGRFRWVSGVTALDRGTRVLAREVVEVMERIERGDVG